MAAAAAAAVLIALTGLVPAATARSTNVRRVGGLVVRVDADSVTVGNGLVERRWRRAPFTTEWVRDLRSGRRVVAGAGPDFALRTGGGTVVASDAFTVTGVTSEPLAHGLRVRMALSGGLLDAERVVDVYRGVAGFRTTTVLAPKAPLALTEVVLEEAAVGPAAATVHAFRAGADWREPGWGGPQVAVGDAHPGTWRSSVSGGPGEAVAGPGQWVSAGPVFLVAERNDLPSSRAGYDGASATVGAEYARDVVSLGPFEEDAHVEQPAGGAGRSRTLLPGRPFPLEAVFTGVARDADDEGWQFTRYLQRRAAPYRREVTFNSNGTDDNRISTGAKDDMDLATVREVAPMARRLGVETFILDDGWQATSGDWVPDPRRGFDPDFANVRAAIAPMRLGLWMSPMHFHPASATYQAHPDWVCAPAGHGLAAYNTVDQTGGSNEAGIGEWGPAAIPHIEARLTEAIERWHVEYFKFDFLAWLDCAGQGDLYGMHDALVAMVDRLERAHPGVTFQIDETNDYRLFPFESVVRGPSWFQNGSPGPERLLHNLWNLSPYLPAASLGQHVLGGKAWEQYPVDTLMAVALLGHITYFSDLRTLPPAVVDATAPWTAFYRAHRDLLTGGVVYPLLEDPLARHWTALQAWDPDAGRGALLAFRQDDTRPSVTVALRNVLGNGRFDLLAAPTGQRVATVTAAQLRVGIPIDLPAPRTARVLLIVPAP